MIEVLFAIGAAITSGLTDPLARKTMDESGRYKAIVYNFIFLSLFLIMGAVLLGIKFAFPSALLPTFIIETLAGALGIIAYFKALESGKVSALAPLSTVYVLLVVILGITIFGERLTALQIAGGILVILAGVALGFEDISKFRPEKGVLYILIAIFSWGYYYGFIKPLIVQMGAYMAILALEISMTLAIILYYFFKNRDISLPSVEGIRLISLRSFIIFLSTVFYAYSVDRIGVALTSVITASSPLITVPASYVMLKEKLSTYKYAAVVLIVIGLAMILA